MGRGDEQTTHTVEEVGWLHHIWDEVGPQFVTGLCSIIALAFAAYVTVWAKNKFFPKHES